MTEQIQVKDYYSFIDYDQMIGELEKREVSEWELEAYPYIRGFKEGSQVYIDGRWRDVNEQALQQFLNLIGARCGTVFALEVLNDGAIEEKLNEIFLEKWKQRYTKEKTRPIILHLAKDIFAPQGDVRASTTDLFRRLPSLDVGEFLQFFDEFTFNRGIMRPSMTQFDFVSEQNTIEIKPGDLVQIGLSFTNSEFATRSLQIAFNTFRLICMNGVTTKERFFNEKIVHRRKNEADFYNGVGASVKRLNHKVDGFIKSFKSMIGKPVNINKIEDILETPITNTFARISQDDKAGIIKAFKEQVKEEGVIEKISRMDIFNAATRYIRDNRDKEKNEILIKGISGLMGR